MASLKIISNFQRFEEKTIIPDNNLRRCVEKMCLQGSSAATQGATETSLRPATYSTPAGTLSFCLLQPLIYGFVLGLQLIYIGIIIQRIIKFILNGVSGIILTSQQSTGTGEKAVARRWGDLR